MKEFVTLGQYEAAFQSAVDPEAYAYVTGGSGSQLTLRRNRAALERLAIEQRIGNDTTHIDLSTTFLGMKLAVPYTVCPMGGQPRVWPNGEIEMVKGVSAGGGLTVTNPNQPREKFDAATGPMLYQLYNMGPRDWIAERVELVQSIGYAALALTVDTNVLSRRDADMEAQFLAHDGLVPNPRPNTAGSDYSYMSIMTWDYFRWLRGLLHIPFGLKGIMHPDDARKAIDCGCDFIWISNHGGRQLDSGRATIDVLPRIAAAVNGQVPIVIDGGFRRGTDIIKGLCLGATIVGLGRPFMWGLAQGGAAGAENIWNILRAELMVDMTLAGQTSLANLHPDLIGTVDY